MSKAAIASSNPPHTEIVELKDPAFAAVLAFLVPGLGHIYQGRTAKGILFAVCILGIFFSGLALGHGKVVYASWTPEDKRLYYLCQVWVGLPALPALLQNYLVRAGKDPLFGGVMAPPTSMAELNSWYRTLNAYFDLGTVYTTIAGLLNVLVIYDAWGGPSMFEAEEEKKREEKKREKMEREAGPTDSA